MIEISGSLIWSKSLTKLIFNPCGDFRSRAHSPTFPSLHLRHSSFSNTSVALPTSQLILQPFRCFTSFSNLSVASPTSQALHFREERSRAHSSTFPSLHLRNSSFSNTSVTLPTSQLILQSFRCFTYVTAHSPTFPLLLLRHRLFTYVKSRAELILQPFLHFNYFTAHSPTLPSLYLRHSSFSNPSVASPTSQLVLQPFFCFSYVTGSSLTSLGEQLKANSELPSDGAICTL